MGHQHSHNHSHFHGPQDSSKATKNLRMAFWLNFCFSVIELIGGLLTGSIAILSDALHDFGDSLTLGMAVILEGFANKGATKKFSYGFRRLSLLSAGMTSFILVSGSIFILYKSFALIGEPHDPNSTGMIVMAFIGIAVNGFAAYRMHHGETLNEKAISWHFFEDILGWILVLVGAVVIKFFELPIIDPILSIIFACVILIGVGRTITQILHLFLQATPGNLNVDEISKLITKIQGIFAIHDIHIWSLDGTRHVMTMHVVVSSDTTATQAAQIKSEVRKIISTQGDIHVTIELEASNEDCPDLNCTTL